MKRRGVALAKAPVKVTLTSSEGIHATYGISDEVPKEGATRVRVDEGAGPIPVNTWVIGVMEVAERVRERARVA